MAEYRLTPAAAGDIREIGEFTNRVWGAIQRKYYLSELAESLDRVARHPELGRNRDDIQPGLKCVAFQRHLIFYNAGSDGVEIARVLYGSRDVVRHLGGN